MTLLSIGGAAAPYNPTLFRLRTKDGTIYEVDERLGLQKVVERNGNYLTIEPNLITYVNVGTGQTRAVRITRDPANDNRIVEVRDLNDNPHRRSRPSLTTASIVC